MNSSSSGVEGHKPIFYLLNNQPLVPISKIFQNQTTRQIWAFAKKKFKTKKSDSKNRRFLLLWKAPKNLRVFNKEPEVLVTLKALKNLRVLTKEPVGLKFPGEGVFRTAIMHIENGSEARKIRCPIEYPPHSCRLQGWPVISFWSNRQVGFFWEVLGGPHRLSNNLMITTWPPTSYFPGL